MDGSPLESRPFAGTNRQDGLCRSFSCQESLSERVLFVSGYHHQWRGEHHRHLLYRQGGLRGLLEYSRQGDVSVERRSQGVVFVSRCATGEDVVF